MNGTAEQVAALAMALAAVQAELPAVTKNRTADVKNKEGKFLYAYAYADLADVSAAVLPVLGKHGLAFAALPGHEPDGKFGLRYYLLHSAGGWLDGFFEIDDKGGMQLVGGRITYARRYTLCAVTGAIADEDVDAREDSGPRTVQRKPPRAPQQPQGTVQRRTQTSPPAPAANPRAASTVPPAGAGGDLPPLPGDDSITERTWNEITAQLARRGVEDKNWVRIASQVAGKPAKYLTEAEGRKLASTLKGLEDAVALDGLLADRLMETDPREVPDGN